MFGGLRPTVLSRNRLRHIIATTPREWSTSTRQNILTISQPYSKISNSRMKASLKPFGQIRGVKYLGREWTWVELWRFTWRTQPYSLSFAVASLATLVGLLITALWSRSKQDRKLGTYPPKVGEMLQRAIYYTKVSPDLDKAIKFYARTLQAAVEEGLDPLSDEVIGIKTECSACLEEHGNPQNAIAILEEVKEGCLNWIEKHGNQPNSAARRTKLLSWACRVSTRLAGLYSSRYIGNEQKMEESLVWAVETTLKEKQRREKEGINELEGDWLDDDELGSQLEDLAHMYMKQDKQYFASQLFLNALKIKPKKDCHAVTLMNNLAITIAHHAPPVEPGTPPASPEQLRDNGRSWARKAIALANKIQPPERNEECDVACVVATHNLGEFAEMDGMLAEARQRYIEAGSIAHAIGYEDGVNEADSGLKRLGAGNKSFGRRWW